MLRISNYLVFLAIYFFNSLSIQAFPTSAFEMVKTLPEGKTQRVILVADYFGHNVETNFAQTPQFHIHKKRYASIFKAFLTLDPDTEILFEVAEDESLNDLLVGTDELYWLPYLAAKIISAGMTVQPVNSSSESMFWMVEYIQKTFEPNAEFYRNHPDQVKDHLSHLANSEAREHHPKSKFTIAQLDKFTEKLLQDLNQSREKGELADLDSEYSDVKSLYTAVHNDLTGYASIKDDPFNVACFKALLEGNEAVLIDSIQHIYNCAPNFQMLAAVHQSLKRGKRPLLISNPNYIYVVQKLLTKQGFNVISADCLKSMKKLENDREVRMISAKTLNNLLKSMLPQKIQSSGEYDSLVTKIEEQLVAEPYSFSPYVSSNSFSKKHKSYITTAAYAVGTLVIGGVMGLFMKRHHAKKMQELLVTAKRTLFAKLLLAVEEEDYETLQDIWKDTMTREYPDFGDFVDTLQLYYEKEMEQSL
jgi:hypothetical protein